MRLFPSIVRNERGTTLVEFALLAPVMLMLIAGAIEMGYLWMVRSSLEGAVMTAARTAMADLDTQQDQRDEDLRARIATLMEPFPHRGEDGLRIETAVYRDFGSSYPESFDDANGNGVYDPPTETFSGEAFEDRNRNGKWDPATPIEGKLGGPGDVVSYTAVFPAKLFFSFVADAIGVEEVELTATTVVRNEPIARRRNVT